MKKFMILIAAIAMSTLTAQADNIAPDTDTVMTMEAGTPAPTKGDTDGTKGDTNGTEEGAPEAQ